VRIYRRALSAGDIQTDMNTSIGGVAQSDTQPPSTPSGVTKTGATQTSISISWTASSDNVGVAGYGLYRSGSSVGSTTSTSFSFSGLTCGQSYTLGVDAYDAAGNRSPQATITATTSACSDTSPPTVPGGLSATATSATSVALAWSASSDNVGVAGYDVYRDSVLVGTTSGTSYTVAGLSCGTAYTFAVDAFDGRMDREAADGNGGAMGYERGVDVRAGGGQAAVVAELLLAVRELRGLAL
jgi:chitinase